VPKSSGQSQRADSRPPTATRESQGILQTIHLREYIMSLGRWRSCLVLYALLSTASASSWAGEAHVHGQAQLEIAVEGERLTIRLESPLDNLLGFERAPRTDDERRAVQRMIARLSGGNAQFLPNTAAECAQLDVRLDSPVLGGDLSVHRTVEEKHPDPGAAKAARHDDHDHGEEHGELTATWHFRCARPAALRELTVKLFQDFPGLQRVDAVALGANGQSASRLGGRQPTIRW
jgi:hypothetical protein